MIAFRLPGGVPVYLFALLMGFCATLSLAWTAWQASDDQQAKTRVDAGLSALIGALLVGRAVYVAFHWAYYKEHLGETLLVSAGGLSGFGALVGGFLALAIYAGLEREPFGALADALVPLVVSLTTGAWIGGWLDGAGYGQAVSGWWGLPARDEWGRVALRIPVQLLGICATLGIYWLVNRQKGYSPGWKAGLVLLGICLELFVLSFLRADPAPAWESLRLDVWAFLALAACSGLLLWRVSRSPRNPEAESIKPL